MKISNRSLLVVPALLVTVVAFGMLMRFGGLSFGAPSSNSDADGPNDVTADAGSKKDASTLTVHDLYEDPNRYDGARITVRGYYYAGFEQEVLTSSYSVVDPTTGWHAISNEQVWTNWEMRRPQEFFERLTSSPGFGLGGGTDYYGQVEVVGTFHVHGIRDGEDGRPELGAGHHGEYQYSIDIESVRVFDAQTQHYVPIPTRDRRK